MKMILLSTLTIFFAVFTLITLYLIIIRRKEDECTDVNCSGFESPVITSQNYHTYQNIVNDSVECINTIFCSNEEMQEILYNDELIPFMEGLVSMEQDNPDDIEISEIRKSFEILKDPNSSEEDKATARLCLEKLEGTDFYQELISKLSVEDKYKLKQIDRYNTLNTISDVW